MKIKEMKEKTVEFWNKNKDYLVLAGIVGSGCAITYTLGRITGTVKGMERAVELNKTEIGLGGWALGMVSDTGSFIADRYSNETTFGGAMNNMKEAIKLLSDPKNQEDVYGIMVLSKKNS